MDPLRIGIVSTSWWADLMYIPAIASHVHAELVACCGRHPERTEAFARRHGIGLWFTDFREMFATADLDVVVIGTPEATHHEICLAAAAAGLHVICEKPLAMNLAEAREMVAAVEAAGVAHLTYYTFRWFPWLRYAKQLIGEGYVGRVYESRFSFMGGFGRSREPHWKWDRRRGLGVLGDLGSHMIDLAQWLVGPIVDVDASVVDFVERSDRSSGRVEPSNDSALLSVRYEDGSHGLIEASAVTHLGARQVEWGVSIRGEHGTIQVAADIANGWRSWGVRDGGEWSRLHLPEHLAAGIDENATGNELLRQIFTTQQVGIRGFIDAVAEGRRLEPSLVDGYLVQRVLETAFTSSRAGRRTSVAETCGPV